MVKEIISLTLQTTNKTKISNLSTASELSSNVSVYKKSGSCEFIQINFPQDWKHQKPGFTLYRYVTHETTCLLELTAVRKGGTYAMQLI